MPQITYTFTYQNGGTGTAEAFTIVDKLPPGAGFVSATNGGTFAAGGGNVISEHGRGIIATGGGNIIATGGDLELRRSLTRGYNRNPEFTRLMSTHLFPLLPAPRICATGVIFGGW